MSATAAIAFPCNSPKEAAASCCEKRYGEVLVIQRHVVLRCLLCGLEDRIYQKFLEHIISHCREDEKRVVTRSRRQSPDEHGHASSDTRYSDCVVIKDTLEPVDTEPEQITAEAAQCTAEIAGATTDNTPISDEDCAEITADDSTLEPSPMFLAPKRKNKKSTERKYKCATCGLGFADLSNMYSHSKRHTGNKPYACNQCEKRFYSNTELATHVRHHTGERPYICAYCGQCFKTNSMLRDHERRHTNERPHKCEFCNKCFYDTKQLRCHLVVHTQERNHVCNTCNGRFSRRKALLVHMKLHVNAREYACDLCDMAFNQLPALLLHRKSKHKVIDKRKGGRPPKIAPTKEVEL